MDNGLKRVAICFLLWIVCSSVVYTKHRPRRDLNIVHEWSQIEFDYHSEVERQANIDSGFFRDGTIVPLDCDVYYSGNTSTVFITTPRIHSGTPVTLGIVTDRTRNGNPIVAPYPSWSWHNNSNECPVNGISSAFRITIDECERLWVIDIGPLNDVITCPARLLVFDLRTNHLLLRYEFPNSVLLSNSFLSTLVVDVVDQANSCRNTFVYLGDVRGFQMIVYDLAQNRSWAVRDRTMYPYPNYGIYNIAGQQFYIMDGIVGMSLTPNKPGEPRRLFYHAMSSPTENWVYTSYLRNETIFRNNPFAAPQIFHTYRNTRSTQSSAEAIDRDGIMYYGLLGDIKIACFNTQGIYQNKNSTAIIADNPVTLQFPDGVKISTNSRGRQELWILTSRAQYVATGTMFDVNETNFRIMVADVNQLVSGTSCRHSQPRGLTNNPDIYLP
ncbi:unnamed protein product [Phaedon cochleariae]|uniref:Yellow-like protein n=1 Tax=Phaedon cochleariae TaxID=80249 RepID=A0A9P0GR69_PHACE|nr:unnamed protein product [Phaedon cochleariae]